MAITATRFTFLSLFLLFLSPHLTFSAYSPSPSTTSFPSPSPSPFSSVRAPCSAPASSPLGSSPPASTMQDRSPGSSPAPSPVESSSLFSHEGVEWRITSPSGSGGMSSTKKVGIVIGVVVAATVVVLAGMGFKKRQQNIQRSQYRYEARREIL